MSTPTSSPPPPGSGPAAAPRSGIALGAVHLSVADIARSVRFYGEAIGLRVLSREPGEAALGVPGRELVVLREEPGAVPARGAAGLFHLALLLPERAELARWLAHAAQEQIPLTGLSDHFVSEAIYLDDPDGHGIEVYADRPRERWAGQVPLRLVTERLDVGDLLATLGDRPPGAYGGMPAGTTMGHVHLRVADVAASVAFYEEVLGLAPMAVMGRTAAFLGADGYHHHVGVNTWGGAGVPLAGPGTARLLKATVVLPDAAAREAVLARAAAAGRPGRTTPSEVLVHDPSGIALELRLAADGA